MNPFVFDSTLRFRDVKRYNEENNEMCNKNLNIPSILMVFTANMIQPMKAAISQTNSN